MAGLIRGEAGLVAGERLHVTWRASPQDWLLSLSAHIDAGAALAALSDTQERFARAKITLYLWQ